VVNATRELQLYLYSLPAIVSMVTNASKAFRIGSENGHLFHFRLSWRRSWSKHFWQTLRPGTSGELCQVQVSLDPHLTHVVPAAVKISLRCEERETQTAHGEQETNRGGERRAFAFA
jgi:hypothetical protein